MMPAPLPVQLPCRATRVTVDLGALRHNFRLLQASMPAAGLIPTVKANGYGHGAVVIAKQCLQDGAVAVAVATLDECAALRQAQINCPIIIFGQLLSSEIPAAIALQATFAVGDLAYATTISQMASNLNRIVNLHVEIDTGMGRLGLPLQRALTDLIAMLQLPYLKVWAIFHHYADCDEEDPTLFQQQQQRFDYFCNQLTRAGYVIPYRHSGNSAAILRFAQQLYHDNLARPGIALYGMQRCNWIANSSKLKPLLRWSSRLVKVVRYQHPWTVGYGADWQPQPGSVVGIVPVGYADGYRRIFAERAVVLIRGRRVAVRGRISMDLLSVDLTALSQLGETPDVGEEVVLLGQQQYRDQQQRNFQDTITAEDLAQLAGTISYEITCAISSRVPRIYQ